MPAGILASTLGHTDHPYRSLSTTAIRARDHFQIVTVGVGKVDPASAVVMIDLAGACLLYTSDAADE